MTPTTTTILAAAEHPLIDIDLTVVLQLVLFGILFFALNKLLFQPFMKLREARKAGIEGARDEAVRMSAEADAKMVEFEKSLAAARSRAGEESRKIRTEAAAHEKEVTDKARATASQALDAAQSKVRGETLAARKELAPQADILARQMASKLLGREVA